MKVSFKIVLVLPLILLLFLPGMVFAKEIAVIANSSFPIDKVNKSYLKKVYLGKKTDERGTKIVPLDYQSNGPAKRNFIGKLLLSTVGKYQAYWLKQIFREGRTAPDTVSNAQMMVNKVRKTKGAIGYLHTVDLKNKQGIKILYLMR